jgi:hypothetical protein
MLQNFFLYLISISEFPNLEVELLSFAHPENLRFTCLSTRLRIRIMKIG